MRRSDQCLICGAEKGPFGSLRGGSFCEHCWSFLSDGPERCDRCDSVFLTVITFEGPSWNGIAKFCPICGAPLRP